LNGIPLLNLKPVEKKQSIATTRSFDKDYRTFEEVRERITTFIVSCSKKLRSQHSLCNSMQVFIESNRFREHDEYYSKSVMIKLPFPTNSSIELAGFALQGLTLIYKKFIGYKRAGVVVMDFVPDNEYQPSLFLNSNPKHKILMATVDKLNGRFGMQKVRLAGQDQKVHKMKQERLSPCFTTNFKDIFTINL